MDVGGDILEKEIWKKGTLIYPLPAVLVTCGNGTCDNILTVAWTGTICTEPAMCYISIRKERYSYDLIKQSGEFCINLTTQDLIYATDYAGVKSGKNENKIEKLNLHLSQGENKYAKILDESPVNIECVVKEIKELGSHDMFIAEVKCIHADKKYFDENGAFDMEKCGMISYIHGRYYETGKNVGKFGFSVRKK